MATCRRSQRVLEQESISPEPSPAKNDRLGVKDLMILLHDLVYILAAVALIFVFFVRVISVGGESMLPTLEDQDTLILLSGLWYNDPQPGDIVVARIPEFSTEPIIKRVIAVEGDTVDIDFDAGTVSVNGEILQEDYILESTFLEFGQMGLSFPVTIEPGCVFLLGDNRNDSVDSRFALIGQVDTRYILGKAVFLLLPGKDPATQTRDLTRIGSIQ